MEYTVTWIHDQLFRWWARLKHGWRQNCHFFYVRFDCERYFMLNPCLQYALIDRKAWSRPVFVENHLVLAHSYCHAHSIEPLDFLLACTADCLLAHLFVSKPFSSCLHADGLPQKLAKNVFFRMQKSFKKLSNKLKKLKNRDLWSPNCSVAR